MRFKNLLILKKLISMQDIVNNQLNSIENEKVKKVSWFSNISFKQSDFDTIKYNNQKKFFKAEEGGYYQSKY